MLHQLSLIKATMKIFFLVFLLLISNIVSAGTRLNKVVVFGDSLSDNGNLYEYMKHQLPISPPYYKGRFTNGPVWVELLMKYYHFNTGEGRLFNYAYGGAGVIADEDTSEDDVFFTLSTEINSYLVANHDQTDDNALYVVWIGSNNYLSNPDNPEKMINDVNKGLQRGLQQLVDKGAKHIMVVNVPDLGKTPMAIDYEVTREMTDMSNKHNELIRQNALEWQKNYPQVQWIYFDINLLFDDVTQHPERYGFTNISGTCYEQAAEEAKGTTVLKIVSNIREGYKKKACDGYLFFDPVHPSGAAHVYMAERAHKLLEEMDIQLQ